MKRVTFRSYESSDFKKVGDFLVNNYQANNADGNWLQPAWEYMHSHPNLDEVALNRIGIWEQDEKVVGVAHYESVLGEAFFQVHPDLKHLKPAMLRYAEDNLLGEAKSGEKYLRIYVNDFDTEFENLVRSRGYELVEPHTGPLTQFTIPHPFPPIELPDGFTIKSLADENDLHKIHRVLWRGFNHPGEPPEDGLEGRIKMQSGPNFRKDLTIVVVEPGGNFVSFCGMWYEPVNKIAYVEPVATDPDYRRIGLGKAAVWEGIRRCGEEGATIAYVGSDLEFYLAIGFTRCFNRNCWIKHFP